MFVAKTCSFMCKMVCEWVLAKHAAPLSRFGLLCRPLADYLTSKRGEAIRACPVSAYFGKRALIVCSSQDHVSKEVDKAAGERSLVF